jgi:hypothetical protein
MTGKTKEMSVIAIFILACVLVALWFLPGCSTVTTALDILAPPDPVPVCDKDSAGVTYQDKQEIPVKTKQCMKFSDGTFRWVEVNK